MRVERLWVPGRLWGLNEIIALRASRYRGAYSSEKRKFEAIIAMAAEESGLTPWPDGAWFAYELVEPDQRRDPSNAMSGAIKVIEDGLQACGVLPGDGWRHVRGINPTWRVDKERPGVLVTLSDAPV